MRHEGSRFLVPTSVRPVVLIVEDHADTRSMLATWFQHCGCRAVEAANAEDALLGMAQWRPDAIITDIALKGMGGLEFCRLVRRDPATRAIPLIAATGWVHPRLVEGARRAGCDNVFVKPYTPSALSDEVLRAIAAARTRPSQMR